MKTIYLIRHCKALGQEPEADLSPEGVVQSQLLSDFLLNKEIELVFSSPFVRAINSIKPFIDRSKVKLQVDKRLEERVLSKNDLTDWVERLRESFEKADLKLEGGESSTEATKRGIDLINEIKKFKESKIAIVSHGNLLSLMIRSFNNEFGFNNWKEMKNPDVFELIIKEDKNYIKQIWQ